MIIMIVIVIVINIIIFINVYITKYLPYIYFEQVNLIFLRPILIGKEEEIEKFKININFAIIMIFPL